MYEIKVYNKPAYADDYEFIVVRLNDGEFWFWGAWDTEAEAQKVAKEIDGAVFRNI